MNGGGGAAADRRGSADRRDLVLDAALEVFARFGYRKTSMEDVAAAARISRPGLYFLFSSKAALFRAATERAIELDLEAAERALAADGATLVERVVAAFDRWAGRYIGPMRDVQTLVADDPDLLGPGAVAGPDRFQQLLLDAINGAGPDPEAAARTLISVSVGLKHQVSSRDEYLERVRTAAELVLGPGARR